MSDEPLVEPDWASLVPEVTLRPQQHEALTAIWTELYVNDVNVVFLEAPTGVGKSIIQLALCRHAANAYMVTPQRVLQDQMRGWDNLKIMKGKGAYECKLVAGVKASNAPCTLNVGLREENPECHTGSCPYFTALEAAKNSPMVVHNYASLMAQANIGKHFGPRSLLCLDEGHTAVEWIRNYMSCEFEPHELSGLTTDKPPMDLNKFLPWLMWTLASIEEVPKNLPDKLAATLFKILAHPAAFGLRSEDSLRHKWSMEADENDTYEKFAKKLLMKGGSVPWSTLWSEPDRWHENGMWSTIPLRVAPVASTLTRMGRKILIVTATVLNKPLMMVELGIKADEAVTVTIDSAFPVEARPITKMYAGKMSFKNRRNTMPKLINKLERIASKHHDQPGMVHTVSHRLSAYVAEALGNRLGGRIVEQLPVGPSREGVIHQFLSGALGPNAILVGPSLMEGVDGAGDSCRWQALCKAPWPYMMDPVVQRLMNSKNPNTKLWAQKWYMWKAAQQTVQGIGRVCRSEDDYGITYILDSDFERILSSAYIPQYIKDAIIK